MVSMGFGRRENVQIAVEPAVRPRITVGRGLLTALAAAECRTLDANDSDAAARMMPPLPVAKATDEFNQENSVAAQGPRS